LAITGTIDNFSVSIQGGHTTKNGGLIPQVKLTNASIDINPD